MNYFWPSPEQKIRQQKQKIIQLIEEACVAECEGDFRKALAKAKEASNKERMLIRLQEQAELGDLHDIDLTFVVSFSKKKTIIILIKKSGFVHSGQPIRRQ